MGLGVEACVCGLSQCVENINAKCQISMEQRAFWSLFEDVSLGLEFSVLFPLTH